MAYGPVIAFWQRVQNDTGLQQSVKALENTSRDKRPEQIVKLGTEKGFSFTPKELLEIDAVLAFWQKVNKDSGLQNRLEPVQKLGEQAAANEVVKIANDAGFAFSNAALAETMKAQVGTGELQEKQLDAVAGGLVSTSLNMAIQGSFAPTFKRIGPGGVAEYM
jgi:predicted ribosomally synthesized peptide with nif11-like leader